EFLYVQDMANICVELLTSINAEDIYKQGITHINIGTGKDLKISDLASLIAEIVQYSGKIIYDKSNQMVFTKNYLMYQDYMNLAAIKKYL
ncbi:MAG: hypothetical protein V3W20_09410, partial [Candidatus Neomarinimicrobiota bacterium]